MGMKIKPNFTIADAAGGLAGIKNLMVLDKLYANQARLDVVKTTGTYPIITIPANAVLEGAIIINSAAFNGTVKVGKSGADEEYIPDASYGKTLGAQAIVVINKIITAKTTIQLKTSGNTTGAGILWLLWRPLI